MTLYLPPSCINYSQNSISSVFIGGNALLDVFEDLVRGELTPEDLPPIEVRKYQGEYVAFLGNRRLFLYKKLEEAGIIDEIPFVRFKGWKTITGNGNDIFVRGYQDIDEDMDDILERYREDSSDSDTSSEYDSDSDGYY